MARLPKVYQRERDLRAHVLLFVLTLASTVPAASAQLFAARALNDAAFAIGTQFNCPATAADCPVAWRATSGGRDILVEQPEAPRSQTQQFQPVAFPVEKRGKMAPRRATRSSTTRYASSTTRATWRSSSTTAPSEYWLPLWVDMLPHSRAISSPWSRARRFSTMPSLVVPMARHSP